MKWQLKLGAQLKAGDAAGRWFARLVAALAILGGSASAAEAPVAAQFRKDVQPILNEFCYDCHADGEKKGEIAFDELKTDAALLDHDLWSKALKNVRAGLMPPAKKPQPSAEQREVLARWIKYSAFGIDPKNPDPGRVTVRRLNRVEYRNSIHDLMGLDFNAEAEFPPDDTGYGFDNIGDVLTISPMLLEKYLAAAKSIVADTMPLVSRVMPERVIAGARFRTNDVAAGGGGRGGGGGGGRGRGNNRAETFLSLPYDQPAKPSTSVRVEHAGNYQLLVEMVAKGAFNFDPATCNVIFQADGRELLKQEFAWQDNKTFEAGIAQATAAVLASPRFLFRMEEAEAAGSAVVSPASSSSPSWRDAGAPSAARFASVDEYALASRLFYFLWSTMPDEELFRLAGRGELRKNLPAQVKRMLDDSRSEALVENFTGQWLQTRDVEGITINARDVLARDNGTEKEIREQQAAFQASQAARQLAQAIARTNAAFAATNQFAQFGRGNRGNRGTNGFNGTNGFGFNRGGRFGQPRIQLDNDVMFDMLTLAFQTDSTGRLEAIS